MFKLACSHRLVCNLFALLADNEEEDNPGGLENNNTLSPSVFEEDDPGTLSESLSANIASYIIISYIQVDMITPLFIWLLSNNRSIVPLNSEVIVNIQNTCIII